MDQRGWERGDSGTWMVGSDSGCPSAARSKAAVAIRAGVSESGGQGWGKMGREDWGAVKSGGPGTRLPEFKS